MAGNKLLITTKDLAIISLMTTILFVQEQLLTSLPGIQLTFFLIVLFSKKLGFTRSVIIVILHVLLDNFYMSSFGLFYTPVMLIGLLIIPFIITILFKKNDNPIVLAMVGFLCSFIYCWLFVIPNYLVFNIDPIAYLISDFIFELILAVCSFISILLLYKPCSKIFDLLIPKTK